MPKKIGPWTQLSSKIKYTNNWISIREDIVLRPNGKKGLYGVVESKGDSVLIVPMTKDKKFVLIKLYRYPTRTWSWELPSGGSEKQPLLSAAKRELLEEAGYKAKTWNKLGKAQCYNGVGNEWINIYLAQDLTPTNLNANLNDRAEEGIVETKIVSYNTVKKMIANGDISDSQAITAFYFAASFLKLK